MTTQRRDAIMTTQTPRTPYYGSEYRAGYAAANSLPRTANPYPKGTLAHSAWDDGWTGSGGRNAKRPRCRPEHPGPELAGPGP
jgi:hypothetical protein